MSGWDSIIMEMREHLPDFVFREVADYDLCAKVMACGTTYFYPSSPGTLCIYTDTEVGEFDGMGYGLIFEEYVASRVRSMPLTDLGQLVMFLGCSSQVIRQAALDRVARGRLLGVIRSGRRARWSGAWRMIGPLRRSRNPGFGGWFRSSDDPESLDAILDEILR